jgi:signal transduction histidine kinase
VLLGLCVAAVSLLGPNLGRRLAIHAPTLRATIETGTTLCAVAAALLFGFAFTHTRHLRDLILLGALLEGALVAIASYRVSPLVSSNDGGLSVTAPLIGMLLVSAAAAVAGLSGLNTRASIGRRLIASAVAAAIFVAVLVELCGAFLPAHAVVAHGEPAPRLDSASLTPLGVALALGAAMLFGIAAIAIARTTSRHANAERLLAGGFIALGAAVLQYMTVPSLAPDRVAPREALLLLGYIVILGAGLLDEAAVRREAACRTAAQERRRIARDLHDGLAQDLAFIVAHGARLTGDGGENHSLELAARRALAISRGAITDLSEAETAAARQSRTDRLSGRQTFRDPARADATVR